MCRVKVKGTRYALKAFVFLLCQFDLKLATNTFWYVTKGATLQSAGMASAFNSLDRGVFFPAHSSALNHLHSVYFTGVRKPRILRCCLLVDKVTLLRSRPLAICASVGTEVDDPHSLLGIQVGATPEQIKSAFKQQAKLIHPDVSKLPEKESTEKFKALVVAYADAIRMGKEPPPPQPLKLDIPDGLSAEDRKNWLIQNNKIVLFMRGTKQVPLDQESKFAVSVLSIASFDTNQRFAAFNLETDSEVADAVMQQSGLSRPPVCFIDGKLIGGPAKLEELYESSDLRRLFGAVEEDIPCPESLYERTEDGKWKEPENWLEVRFSMRLERNPINCRLEWVEAKPKGQLEAAKPGSRTRDTEDEGWQSPGD